MESTNRMNDNSLMCYQSPPQYTELYIQYLQCSSIPTKSTFELVFCLRPLVFSLMHTGD